MKNHVILRQSYAKSNQKQPLMLHPIPKRSWEKIAIDFMRPKNKENLLTVDYLCKFFHYFVLSTKRTCGVVSCFKSVFAIHGYPSVIISNCVPPFD